MNTNWSSPKTNVFAGLLSLRSALASGHNAELIRMHNKDCAYPIKFKEDPEKADFRAFKFSIGYQSTHNKLLETISHFNQYLTFNFISVYGTPEAMKHYYKTGVLSDDNCKGMGRNHLVKVDDLIAFYFKKSDAWSKGRATQLYAQYRDPATHDMSFFYDFFSKEHGSEWTVKTFKHKLWVVNLLDKTTPVKTPLTISILNTLMKPLYVIMKFTPRKSVLRMPDYTNHTLRIGGITNGFSVQIQIPKKFNFK